jgi:Uncharacterized conserved protein
MASRAKTRARSTSRRSKNDAISLLKRDHAAVRQLLKRFEQTTEGATELRETLLSELETEIKLHSRIEEEIFYPAFKEAAGNADENLYFEAIEEHGLVDVVIPQLKRTAVSSEKFAAKAKVLKDLVEHHAEEEEAAMFPRARQVISASQLRLLGSQMQARKEELKAGMLERVAVKAGSTLGKVLSFASGKRVA